MIPSRKISPAAHKYLSRVKANPTEEELRTQRSELQKIFISALPRDIPGDLARELFDWSWDEALARSRPMLPGDVADLAARCYDDREDPLLPEDWPQLKAIFLDFENELDLGLLEYVMIRIVEHGAI